MCMFDAQKGVFMKHTKTIVFRHKDGTEAFRIIDGGTIKIDGKECSVTYIDENYFLVNLKCYSHKSFYEEVVEERGSIVTYGSGVEFKIAAEI